MKLDIFICFLSGGENYRRRAQAHRDRIRDALRVLDLRPGSRGGRKPLRYRHFLIMNLAEMWSELGKGISTGPGSDFAAFCEVIAEYIGWPSDGMSAAIQRPSRLAKPGSKNPLVKQTQLRAAGIFHR